MLTTSGLTEDGDWWKSPAPSWFKCVKDERELLRGVVISVCSLLVSSSSSSAIRSSQSVWGCSGNIEGQSAAIPPRSRRMADMLSRSTCSVKEGWSTPTVRTDEYGIRRLRWKDSARELTAGGVQNAPDAEVRTQMFSCKTHAQEKRCDGGVQPPGSLHAERSVHLDSDVEGADAGTRRQRGLHVVGRAVGGGEGGGPQWTIRFQVGMFRVLATTSLSPAIEQVAARSSGEARDRGTRKYGSTT